MNEFFKLPIGTKVRITRRVWVGYEYYSSTDDAIVTEHGIFVIEYDVTITPEKWEIDLPEFRVRHSIKVLPENHDAMANESLHLHRDM